MSLLAKFSTVGSATLASRFLGFGREALLAAALGAGPVADAFYAAFRFPNLFRRLFAEGAFNAAFVPLFAKELEGGGTEAAKRFSEEVFGALFAILLVMTIAMELAMPLLVRTIVAPGFSGDVAKFDMTVKLALIMFPYMMCMSLTAMMSGILNSLRRYFVAAIAPVLLNVILVGVLLAALFGDADPVATGTALGWGVLAAGLSQLLLVALAVRRNGMQIGFRKPSLTPAVKRLLLLAAPAAITGGITQINLVIGQIIASGKPGAISVLQYADRVYQLPLGVVGIAVGVVLLPELARALKAQHLREAGFLQNRSVEFSLFMTLPAAAALLVMSPEIVNLLYQRGAFTAETTDKVAGALAIFGLGLPAFVMIKAFTPGYFAREDTRTPMKFAAISVAINTGLAIALFPHLAERGIAIAEVCAGWTNAGLLFFTLQRRGQWSRDEGFIRRLPRLLAATALTGLALWFGAGMLASQFATDATVLQKLGAIAALVFGGAIVYFALAFSLGGADRGMIGRSLARKPAADEAAD